MFTNDLHKQVSSLTELFDAMYSQYCCNPVTTGYRADIAADFISLLTNAEERDNGEDFSTRFLWMERQNGTCLLGNGYATDATFTSFYRPDTEKQRYYILDVVNFEIRRITVEEVDTFLKDWFGFDRKAA
jgi:hypothetical protein